MRRRPAHRRCTDPGLEKVNDDRELSSVLTSAAEAFQSTLATHTCGGRPPPPPHTKASAPPLNAVPEYNRHRPPPNHDDHATTRHTSLCRTGSVALRTLNRYASRQSSPPAIGIDVCSPLSYPEKFPCSPAPRPDSPFDKRRRRLLRSNSPSRRRPQIKRQTARRDRLAGTVGRDEKLGLADGRCRRLREGPRRLSPRSSNQMCSPRSRKDFDARRDERCKDEEIRE